MTGKKTTAKNLVLSKLKDNGIEASKSKVGINFQFEGWNFLLWHDAEDPLFLRLTLPGIYDVTDNSYAQALMACNTLNWNYKVVKASLYEYEEGGKRHASVWVCFEQMLDDASVSEVVSRATASLIDAAERFQSLMDS